MNPEIEELEDALDAILRGLQEAIQSGQALSDEFQAQIAEEINFLTGEIDRLYIQQEEQEKEQGPTGGATIEAPMPPGADLLWILSGGNEEAFVNYLRTFPDPALNALLQNPQQLFLTIEQLKRNMPAGQHQEADGIEKAPLESSNIYGFKYEPKNGRLLVRFQNGSVYGYQGIHPGVFKAFQSGAVPAKTTGQNQYGRWWTGKQPSLGAAFYNLIRQGGYPYQKLS